MAPARRLFRLLPVFFVLCALVPRLYGQEVKGPILRIDPSPVNFDTAFCQIEKCRTLTFSNVGDTALTVRTFDALLAPFSGDVTVPFSLNPGQSRSFNVCYTPPNAPRVDSQQIGLRADTRISLSMGLVFDVSGSMNTDLQPGVTRIQAAHDAGVDFVNSLLNTPDVQDEAAIMSFEAAENFTLLTSYTNDKVVLANAVPSFAGGVSTCIYDALIKTIQSLRQRSLAKVIVLLTDGVDSGPTDCGPVSSQAVVIQALVDGVRIFTVGIGTTDETVLNEIASGTGGQFFSAATSSDLIGVYRQIATLLSQNVPLSLTVQGRAVNSQLAFSPDRLDFLAIEVGQTKCLDVQISNTGEAPLSAEIIEQQFQPFALQGQMPANLLPGEQTTVQLCFTPTAPGSFLQTIHLDGNGCDQEPLPLTLFGAAYTVPTEARGPILRLSLDTLNFDTTSCNNTKCIDVTISNIGDTIATVKDFSQVPLPFSAQLPSSFTLEKNESRTITICYTPTTAPSVDTGTVFFTGDSRLPLSIGMVFDVSGSMQSGTTSDGIALITAANNAGRDFISGMLNTPDLKDEAAVIAFEEASNFQTRQDFTTDKDLLTVAVPTTAPGSATCIYDALTKTINALQARNQRRVIIILTDGEDTGPGCGPATPASVIAAANAAGVTIYSVGIAAADPAILTQIATQTQGRFYTASSSQDLIGVYRQIATEVSKNLSFRFFMRGRAVTPIITMIPPVVEFDSVKVGLTKCRVARILNTGDAPLNIDTVFAIQSYFRVDSLSRKVLMPGDTAILGLCYSPSTIRIQNGDLRFIGNTCIPQQNFALTGIGWDSVAISLTGTYSAKPGNVLNFPIRLHRQIPDHYDVRSFSLTLRYNKTLLHIEDSPVKRAGSLSSVFNFENATTTYTATVGSTIIASTGLVPLVNPAPDTLLLRAGFTALQGNAMQTNVEIIEAIMADGNPRVRIISPGVFLADSLCFQDQRLIDASQRIAGAVLKNAPNPFTSATSIFVTVPADGYTRLTVYDTYGREAACLMDGFTEAGDYVAVFDGNGLPAGMYHYRLETGGQIETRSMLLVK